ncbi:MAG: hypothetical protein SGJ19_29345 [Planctomycetia bacterium]|nr:hypothetical protein [Planctomycetia bacterium]
MPPEQLAELEIYATGYFAGHAEPLGPWASGFILAAGALRHPSRDSPHPQPSPENKSRAD